MVARRQDLPPPEHCDVCGSVNVIQTQNDRIYGRTYNKWPEIYFCQDCKAAVGCHPDTLIPLGKMATPLTRKLRAKAHESFDRIWREKVMHRAEAYAWLAKKLGIPTLECHISWLNDEQLRQVPTIVEAEYDALVVVAERRKKKKREQRIDTYKRDTNHANRRRKTKRR